MSIAPRQRGAWIETAARRETSPGKTRIAPRQRGAWIETADSAAVWLSINGIAPRQRGAWIETTKEITDKPTITASLPGNGERGLKRPKKSPTNRQSPHRSPATGSVD